jgi:hypothetical protein
LPCALKISTREEIENFGGSRNRAGINVMITIFGGFDHSAKNDRFLEKNVIITFAHTSLYFESKSTIFFPKY